MSASGPDVVSKPALAVDQQGNVYVAWIVSPFCVGIRGRIGVIEARVQPAAGDWGPVTRVATGVGGDELPRLAITVDEDGSAYVEWTLPSGNVQRARLPAPSGE